MLKLLKLKKKKQFITIISDKLKLSLFGRDDTRQTKVIIFTVVSQAEQVPKVQKKKFKRILKKMLLEPSFFME